MKKKFHLDLSPHTLSHIVAPDSKGAYQREKETTEWQGQRESPNQTMSESDLPPQSDEVVDSHALASDKRTGRGVTESAASEGEAAPVNPASSDETRTSVPDERPDGTGGGMSGQKEASETNPSGSVYIPLREHPETARP